MATTSGCWPGTATATTARRALTAPRRLSSRRWLDELQAEWVRAARRLSPRLVTDLLRWSGPQIAGTFRGEDPRARTASVSWAGPSPVPAWLDQARELSEHWIHRQQILQALGRPSDLHADLAGPVLDGLRWAYPYRLAQAPVQPGDTVTIAITGSVTRTWQLVAGKRGWDYRSRPGPRVIASLTMTTEQAWRLLTNNLPAAAQKHLTASGNNTITGILLRTPGDHRHAQMGVTQQPVRQRPDTPKLNPGPPMHSAFSLCGPQRRAQTERRPDQPSEYPAAQETRRSVITRRDGHQYRNARPSRLTCIRR